MGAFSSEGLHRLHDVLGRHVDDREVPGLVALVSRHDETHVEAHGTTAFGGDQPMERDSIFRIASITKPIVAAATMTLVEDCLLRLDDPVDDLLPELADRRVLRAIDAAPDDTVPAKRPVTVRDLLTLTWGFGYLMSEHDPYPIEAAMAAAIGEPGPPAPQARASTPDEWMAQLGELSLMYQPGERWLYNTGFDVLGVLLARAAGQDLATVLTERIFEPLEMRDTAFSVSASDVDRLVTSYQPGAEPGEFDVYDMPGGQWSRPPEFPSGSGGLLSTADDIAAFGDMLINFGRYHGRRVLSRASVELMSSDQLTAAQRAVSGSDFATIGWGFGLGVIRQRRTIDDGSAGTFWWDGGLGTAFACDPVEQVVTILLTQVMWPGPTPPPVQLDFRTATYAALDD